jgi:c-di-GMP-binding flagellar brake protein YcgR
MMRLLPAVGDEILLNVPHTEHVLVRVDADGPGYFDLHLLEQPLTPRPQLERGALMIEFINDDGVARMHGRLDVPATRRGMGDPVVRFAHRGSPQLLKRREFVRATAQLPLTLILPGADEEVVTADAQALDISGGGLLIGGLADPGIGDEHAFALDLGDGAPPVEGRGEVVRLVGADRAGLHFTELDESGRIRLTQLAFSMSREQRRSID